MVASLRNSPLFLLALHTIACIPYNSFNRVSKINIFSDVVAALNIGLKNKLNSVSNIATWPAYVFDESRVLMKNVITEKIKNFGSNNRI